MKASVEKHSRSERSENITEIEKSHAKIEEKSIVRRLEQRVRKLVRSIAKQAV